MLKIENKLKRLADLGDINASKQSEILLDALGDVAHHNPQVSSVLVLIQSGLQQSLQQASFS